MIDKQNAYWIGLQRSLPSCIAEIDFSCWNDGTSVDYNERWGHDEPSTPTAQHPQVEDCVSFGYVLSSYTAYFWHNIPCNGVINETGAVFLPSYICQRNKGTASLEHRFQLQLLEIISRLKLVKPDFGLAKFYVKAYRYQKDFKYVRNKQLSIII